MNSFRIEGCRLMVDGYLSFVKYKKTLRSENFEP
jgi:hypothetical protein